MKKKRWKSVFAGALTAAMVCNMGLASMAWAEPEEDAGTSLLADFSFDDENDALAGGNAKASGNYTLTDSYDGGKALLKNTNIVHFELRDKAAYRSN